jgi:quercetin dioxygenase-like cupin family protein
VTGGSITLTIGGQVTTYAAGDSCEVLRGTVHAEQVGPEGVKLFVAKRTA